MTWVLCGCHRGPGQPAAEYKVFFKVSVAYDVLILTRGTGAKLYAGN